MTTVSQLLQAKGAEVWSVAPDTSVYDALVLMADKNIGALVVLEAGKLKGIISERDYARKVVLHGKASRDTPVREIMTAAVVTIRPDQTIQHCMALMTDKHIRHLPVIDGERVAGIVSIGDVVKSIISEQRFLIEQLEGYITGSR